MSEKMIQTVTGEMPVSQMGNILIHEHCFGSVLGRWLGLKDCETKEDLTYATRAVTPDMQAWLRNHPFSNMNNLIKYEYEDMLFELQRYKHFGGDTLIDVSPPFGPFGAGDGVPGRFPANMKRLSEDTGIKIIMCTGFAVNVGEMGELADKSKEELAQMLIDDVTYGDKETGIKPGLIKTIMWDVFDPRSTIYLAACAIAQKETGLPFYVHQDLMHENAHNVLDIVEAEGADLSKFVLCHCGPLLHRKEYNTSLLKRGIYLAHDECGCDIYDNSREVDYHFPRDIETVRLVKEYAEEGWQDQLLLGMDICFKHYLEKYGGFGYAHLIRTYYPFMRHEGIPEETIHRIAIENPQRLFG